MKNLKKLKYAFMAIYVLNVMLINFGIMNVYAADDPLSVINKA